MKPSAAHPERSICGRQIADARFGPAHCCWRCYQRCEQGYVCEPGGRGCDHTPECEARQRQP